MTGLVCEGGAFRCIFLAGVLDALIDSGISFDRVYGVSAGASNSISYLSNQRGRNLEVAKSNLEKKHFISKRNFIKYRSIMDIKFAFDTIPNELVPFDYDAFYNSKAEMFVGVTNVETGKPEYFGKQDFDTQLKLVLASCSLPVIFPIVSMCGGKYLDGGIADPIPINKSIKDGNKKHLIVLSRPLGFIKTQTQNDRAVAKIFHRKYPNFSKTISERYLTYNAQTALAKKLEKDGTALILAPADLSNYSSFEKSLEKQIALYKEGYNALMKHITAVRELFN